MPDDRLEEHRRDGVRALVADHVLEALQALRHGPWFLLAPAVRVGIAHDADEARLVRPAARVAGQRHRPERRAVVRAVAGQDLVAARRVAGELDGVLDRLGAAEREEHLVHVARQDLGQLRPEPRADLGRERRLDVLQLERLRGDRVDDPPVAVADVDRHQLAVEVDDPLAFGRIEVDALGVVDGDRVDRALDRPREDRVLLRERGDLVAAHRAGSGADAHRFTSGAAGHRALGRPPLQHIRPARRASSRGSARGPAAELPHVVGDQQHAERTEPDEQRARAGT